MAWRFKASKYKNAAPIVPKAEACVREICVGSYQTYGNNIAASAAFMAFNWEHSGSSVAVLPLDDCGRKSKTMPLLHGHTDTVTDLKFSPFHDGLLATASQDCLVKIWHIPEKGLEQSLSDPEAVFSHKQRRVETVGFHPTADGLMYSTAAGCVALFDIAAQKEIFSNNEHPEVIQSASWREDGTVLATSCKDKCVRIFDPRAAGSPIQMVAESHQSIKDSRVVWLGNQSRILTTGFDAARLRQVIIRDIRNFNTPEKTLELDCSTGILMPLFDPDTNMLFLAGKGDTTINYLEITDKDPYLIEGLRHTGEQTKGACLVPKRALKVMEAEVNRVLQLTSNMVIPIMYQVPRKTYRDFHADLYPETTGYKTELIASEWLNGTNQAVPKMNLDPAKREHGDEPIIIHRGNLSDFVKNLENLKAKGKTQNQHQKPATTSMAKRNDNEHFVMLRKCNNGEERNGNGNAGDCNEKRLHQAKVQPKEECSLNQSELIRKFEAKYKTDSEKDQQAQQLHHHLDDKDSPTEHSTGSSEEASSSAALDTNSPSGSHSPPKPMPRTSRNNSLPESTTPQSGSGGDSECNTPRPRPRTTAAAAYKPRLGPKPFSSNTGDVSFDKVFAVPVAPGSHENISTVGQDNCGDAPAGGSKPDLIVEIEIQKSEPNVAGNGNGNGVQKSLTTSERRKVIYRDIFIYVYICVPSHTPLRIGEILSRQIPGECNGFHANHERVAVPLAGPGGKIAIFELSRPGRLPDGVIPSLVNGSNVMDFQWDPFDAQRLAVACDDGIVKLWRIDEGGLTEPTNEPQGELTAHLDKIYFIRFHPLAADVLLTASYDMTIKLWDLRTMTEKCTLTGHTDQIFDFAWSPCGKLGASVCKDGKIRVYNPRKSETPIREGNGPVGTRGARITWALEGHYIVCTGFDKVSERQISVYNAQKLSAPLNTASLDVSPSILIPFYDEDSSTLFVTGKGDSTIYCYEITDEEPYICPLSHHRCSSLHQGLSFLTKNHCDVASVEFSKAYRLTNTTIEPLSFTVPRIKSELFQDDLFPPTRVTWSATLSAEDWFACNDKSAAKVSLKPEGMDTLSSIQQVPAPVKKPEHTQFGNKSEYETNKQQEIQKSVSARMEYNTKLEQDDMEGVDENEWQE
ncbi:uncharacterized protein Dmoj_GI21649 [Drosophila mojavensis]|uniref:Coronin n=1 Tax=Drosophila mojavensis TaxID=7230 RepID=B4L525_DROMO|nr:uncharacterized protein Dmoj_GI21649 [Drosophila mojavensis]